MALDYEKIGNFKALIKGKYGLISKKSKRIINKLGYARFRMILRFLKPRAKGLSFKTILVLINGGLIYLAVSGIFYPYHIIHQILGYGLALYIPSKLVGRAWTNYIIGKKLISGDEVDMDAIKGVINNDME